jgi:hypothetical protein
VADDNVQAGSGACCSYANEYMPAPLSDEGHCRATSVCRGLPSLAMTNWTGWTSVMLGSW